MSATLLVVSLTVDAWDSLLRDIRIQTALVFTQQRQCFLRLPRPLQYYAHKQLHAQVILPVLLRQLLCLRKYIFALLIVCQQLHGDEVWSLFACKFGGDIFRLAEGDFGAKLKDADGKRIAGGEGGGVKVEDLLEGAGVEGGVDVYELCGVLVVGVAGNGGVAVPPSGE
jgi:hypothetical protein